MVVAIHQPNFMPWLGLFHRISMVDKFIFLDHVQAPRGKSWLSRNKILLNGKQMWLTIPIRRSKRSYQKISDVYINYEINFARKHLGTIKQAYGKCEHFEEVYPLVEGLYTRNYEKLADFNKEYIQLVSKRLGLKVSFHSSQELVHENSSLAGLTGNELILRLCMQAGAHQYISGTGCLDFIDPPAFEKRGIEFYFQQFVHPNYSQINSEVFISHLSTLDALFNIGFDNLSALINKKVLEPVA